MKRRKIYISNQQNCTKEEVQTTNRFAILANATCDGKVQTEIEKLCQTFPYICIWRHKLLSDDKSVKWHRREGTMPTHQTLIERIVTYVNENKLVMSIILSAKGQMCLSSIHNMYTTQQSRLGHKHYKC